MYDYVVIGGGIIGLSTAMQLIESFPNAKIALIEKENAIATHQSGRNSGVIHSGIYYRPGSMKARFAKRGSERLIEFCERHDVPYERCGKLIVAVDKRELPQLEKLYQRGLENGLDVKMLSGEEVNEREPHVRALKGVYVPSTGIVNYIDVATAYANVFRSAGGEIFTNTELRSVSETQDDITLETTTNDIETKAVINCAGLYSDKVAQLFGLKLDVQIVPFRGEYYELDSSKHLLNNLIYPVPNPDFPFLGVHFTRMMNGHVHIGPNAVLSFKREGYVKTDFDVRETMSVLTYPAFWKIAFRNAKEGLQEMYKSISKKAFLQDVQRYFPMITEGELHPADAGVRAQALSNDGKLLDDFLIAKTKRAIHVLNAPSPAATASLEIGRYIVSELKRRLQHA